MTVLDPIRRACQVAGCYTLSVGTSKPTVVLARLLDALGILDPEMHRQVTGPDGEYAAIPAEALRDESNAWWETEKANAFLQRVFGAINDAAPEGFACICSADNRLELARLEEESTVEESRSDPAPRVSALRTRVRPPESKA